MAVVEVACEVLNILKKIYDAGKKVSDLANDAKHV